MDRQDIGPEESGLIEKLDRGHAGRGPGGIPGADVFQQPAPGSEPRPKELGLLGRLAEMDAAGPERIAIDGLANRAQYQRCDRVRRVRRKARAHPLGGGERLDLSCRRVHERSWIRRIESNQLVEDDRRQGAARERLEGHERVADVANDSSTAGS